jgi:hypothetical protein
MCFARRLSNWRKSHDFAINIALSNFFHYLHGPLFPLNYVNHFLDYIHTKASQAKRMECNLELSSGFRRDWSGLGPRDKFPDKCYGSGHVWHDELTPYNSCARLKALQCVIYQTMSCLAVIGRFRALDFKIQVIWVVQRMFQTRITRQTGYENPWLSIGREGLLKGSFSLILAS